MIKIQKAIWHSIGNQQRLDLNNRTKQGRTQEISADARCPLQYSISNTSSTLFDTELDVCLESDSS